MNLSPILSLKQSDDENRKTQSRFCTLGLFSLVLLLEFGILLGFGCAGGSTIFDPTGRCLFNTKPSQGAKTINSSPEATPAPAGSVQSASPWLPTALEQQKSQLLASRSNLLTWSTQRPNGATLFPANLPAEGPIVVVEPKSTIAPIGSEVVVVSSYVGPKNEYLRMGEKLEWGLDGVGHLMTSNPENCLVSCDLHSKKTTDRFAVTTTSSKLWRIHRGTSTPADDITILKGQSWMSVQSSQEGTSSVSVLASNIDNWQNRSAIAQIHWVDAAFQYPQSGVAPIGESRLLSTSVYRKSDPSQGRSGWTVHYEVVSGPKAGFGPGLLPSIDAVTDASGTTNVYLTQAEAMAGTNQILVRVIRPATLTGEQIVVAERTVSQTWTSGALFKLQVEGPQSIKKGTNTTYQIQVTNITKTAQDAIVRLPIPPGTVWVGSSPTESISNGVANWILNAVPAGQTVSIRFDLLIQTDTAIDINPRVDQRTGTTNIDTGVVPTPGVVTNPGTASPMPNPANSPPTLPPTPTGTGNSPGSSITPPPIPASSLQFQMKKDFPAAVTTNDKFDILFTLVNSGSVAANRKVIISTEFPQSATLWWEGVTPKTSPQTFSALPLSNVISKEYPFIYSFASTGQQTIKLAVQDEETKAVLATHVAQVNVVAAGGGGSSGTATPKVDVRIDSTPPPPFVVNTPVMFTFNITNRENYRISGLQLVCVPMMDRSSNPWQFNSSLPERAEHLATSGSYIINVPDLKAGESGSVSMTFTPTQSTTNGQLTADVVQSSNFTASLGRAQLVYSISAQRNL